MHVHVSAMYLVKAHFKIYFQLFENYHVFKNPELKKSIEKTPLASEIDRKLDAESKVGGNDN